ncbi:MAG: hypothetical protein QOF33_1315 [Thermomicrobiales bacterium]|nr:hypothetical protein [Thermomicrobiales bacterium]
MLVGVRGVAPDEQPAPHPDRARLGQLQARPRIGRRVSRQPLPHLPGPFAALPVPDGVRLRDHPRVGAALDFEPPPQLVRPPVEGVPDDPPRGDGGGERSGEHLLDLGGESGLLRHARLGPAIPILRPFVRQGARGR